MEDKRNLEKCSYVFRGNFVHSTWKSAMEILQDKIVGISPAGKILFIEDGESNQDLLGMQYGFTSKDVIFLKPRQFIMPGLVDTHIHAPQYSFTGTGYDCDVVEWLKRYTFPTEAKFKDLKLAHNVYRKLVRRLLKNGTTTASYFATIHYNATLILCDVIVELGQRAYVGISDVDSYLEHKKTTECCAKETERFIKHVIDMNNPLLTPVVTPRGIALCTRTLMTIHGELAKQYNVPIQGHLREIKDERGSWNCASEFSQTTNLAKMYKDCGLLTDKAYYAHCIYLTEDETDLMLSHGTGISHCPASNYDLKSGVADARHWLDRKLKLGLGTDVSGGHSTSMFDAIRQCITASNVMGFNKPESYRTLSHKDAFRLATLGGSEVLGLSDRIGNFEVGKELDALLIDPDAEDSPFDCFEDDTLEDVIQKFLYLGDDRNINQVYVAGRPVAGTALVSTRFSSKRKPGLDINFSH